MKRNKRLLRDLCLIGALLILGLALLGVRALTRKDGGVAVVTVDGKEVGRYPLAVDTEIRLETADGSYNILVIHGGEADVTDADCPDLLCVRQHSIRYEGETIVCLPHRTVITIVGGEDADVIN